MNNKRAITLFCDLDDTLILNTANFAEVKNNIAEEIKKINPLLDLGVSELIRDFDKKEIQNQSKHGDGYENFRVSLLEHSAFLLGYNFFKYQLYKFIDYQINWLKNRPIELIEGVKETIIKLSEKGIKLWILTKGKTDEQKMKISELGVINYFEKIEIMENKKSENYLKIIKKYDLNIEDCFMIGNSPKSDINNPKEIGLKTIFIPYSKTWHPEIEEISSKPPKTIILNSFSELLTLNFEEI